MKLQIDGQKLRIRINEDELQQVRSGGVLVSTTALPGGTTFRLLLELHSMANASMIVGAEGWRIALPLAAVEDYVSRLPCREGTNFPLPTNGGNMLDVAFEVDVRDSVRHRGAAARKR